MPRGKDQKTISKRIDLHYWKKAHRLRSTRMILVLLCVLIAGGWIAYAYTSKKEQLFNPGHVTSAHATIEHNCAACHVQEKGQVLAAVRDSACVECHDAPGHSLAQLERTGDNTNNSLALAVWKKQNNIDVQEVPPPPPGDEAGKEGAGEGAAEAAPDAATAEGEAKPDQGAATSQPKDAHHGMQLVSAQCAACHVEHRGREALAAVSDRHCTQCHEDLTKSLAGGKPSNPKKPVPNRVVAFAKGEHPDFGRQLRNDEGKVVDKTVLNFNHKVHVADQKLTDCSMCHTTWRPNLLGSRPRSKDDAAKPPFRVEGDPSPEWATSNGRYMQPVVYEQHCMTGCHEIKAPGMKEALPHDRMEVVRAAIYASFRESAMARHKVGPPGAEPAKTGGGRGGRGGGSAKRLDEGEWLTAEVNRLEAAITKVQASCEKCHSFAEESVAGGTTTSDAAPLRPDDRERLREWLARAASGEDDGGAVVPALWQGDEAPVLLAQAKARTRAGRTPAAPPAATQPAAGAGAAGASAAAPPPPKKWPALKPAKLKQTVPTGIPNAPRRWFTHSRFDHRSHRDMRCVDCHSKLDNLDNLDKIADEDVKAKFIAMTKDTSEVLSPGIEWEVYNFAKSGDTYTVSTTTDSCVRCHQPDSGGRRYTTNACVTCHTYHDHSQENFPDGHSRPPAQAKAKAETESTGEGAGEKSSDENATPSETEAPAGG